MTWTSQLPEGPSQCVKVKLSDEGICYLGDKLSLKIRNIGDISISGISVSLSDEIKDVDISPRNSEIPAGQVLSREIDYIKTGQAGVKIKAILGEGSEATECVDPSISIRPLKNC